MTISQDSQKTANNNKRRQRQYFGVAIALILLVLCVVAIPLYYYHISSTDPVVPIYMFHRIDKNPRDIWTIKPERLEARLQQLKEEGYTSILPSDITAYYETKKPLPKKPMIITFDDGCKCVELAEPILKKYGFRGVVYLITGKTAEIEKERQTFEGWPCLTWPEVREMRARGTFVFGGHGHTHQPLDNGVDQAREINTCFSEIVNKGGFVPDSFCYPFGAYTPLTVKLVKEAGFTTAMTVYDKPAKLTRKLNLFKLPRVWVRG